MTSRSPSAYVLSVLIHASVVGLILLAAFLAEQGLPQQPKVIELVMGAGDNYAATQAPALGAPGGIKIDIPEVAAPEPPAQAPAAESVSVPTPAELPAPPEAQPREEAPPLPHATLAPAPAPTKARTAAKAKPVSHAVPNFARNLKRVENKRANRLMAKYRKQLADQQRREEMSYEQYLREHGAQGSGSRSSAGIAAGVAGGSLANTKGGAGGRALAREEGDLLDAYFAALKAHIRENLIPPADVNDNAVAVVEFYLGADGSLSRERIVKTSGSAEFDRAALEACAHTRPIGPPPDNLGETVTVNVRVHDEEN